MEEEKRKVFELEKQLQYEKQLIIEAKQSEKEYLKQLKEKDCEVHQYTKKQILNHMFAENKDLMKSIVEKDEKEISEVKVQDMMKKKIVKEELSNQIVERRRQSEMTRKLKLEEVGLKENGTTFR